MEIGFHTFPSGKKYVFIKSADGTRTFLRNILILTTATDPHTIGIVREWGNRTQKAAWEPPKGQMEWKEFSESGVRAGQTLTAKQLTAFQRAGVLREMTEEAKVLPSELVGLTKMPLIYEQDWEDSGLPKTRFMYQYWHAVIKPETMFEAQARMAALVDHASEWKALLPPDMTEKDGIQWWNPERNGWSYIRGAFSKKMTQLYFNTLKKVH